MMRSVNGIHKTSKSERWGHREESFAQVLRCLKVLQVLHEELSCGDVLLHGVHLVLFVARDNDDLIEAESGSGLGNLTHEVGFELK